MQRVDGAYLYELGAKLRPIQSLQNASAKKIHVHHIVHPASEAVRAFLFNSIFISHLRAVHKSANELLEQLDKFAIDFNDFNSFDVEIEGYQFDFLKDKFRAFEAILLAELQNFPLYLVFPKGGFDVVSLTDAALSLFSSSFSNKCPEGVDDVLMGARAMAFELWTAMGFHFHRANEAVLRRYYASVIGNAKRPKHLTMGTMVSSMEQNSVGDANIRAALKNIIVFHRNPVAHPDHHVKTADEALNLYAAIRSCMGYMLDQLGNVEDETQELIPEGEAESLLIKSE